MTRMWVGAAYIISGLPWSLLIFSGCQQHFGDPSEGVPSQTRPCTNTVRSSPCSLMHKQMPGMDKKKAHLTSKTCSKLSASEDGKPSLSQGGSDLSRLEQDSETGSQILLLCMKCPHKNPTFFDNCNASEMCPALGNAFQTLPSHWLVQLLHTCVREPSTSSKCGWWCMLSSKGDFGGHATLLQTPAQYLKWKIRLMVTQGTEMGISSRESIWWHISWLQPSLAVLVYARLKKGFNVSYWTDGNKVIL